MKTIDAQVFRPKLLETVKNYNRQTFMSDLMAGIIVGIVALPLAIAFGIYPYSRIYAITRSLVSCPILPFPEIARDTVVFDTPSASATSAIVIFLFSSLF